MNNDAANAAFWHKRYIETSQKAQDYAAKVGADMERLEEQLNNQESAYQRGYMDGIGRECPYCKDYKSMYIKVRDELAAEQQITQRQTARIVDLQTHIANLEGEE